MANLLGIDEAILDMTVDEYARRSLRTVVALPIIAGLAGLMWVAFDQWWRRRLTSSSERDGFVRRSARGVWLAAVVLALVGAIAAWASGTVPAIAAQAFTAAPLLWAGAVLLVLYGVSLRARLSDAVPMPPTTTAVFRGSIAVLVAVGVFWSAANLAWVEGTNLALRFDPRALPGVEVDSTEPLDLLAPGVTAGCLGEGDGLRYRYRGLRLLESTGGRYFLVSDEWTRRYGAVVVLPIESDTTRFTFVRDTEGVRGDGGFGPCEPGAPDAG